MTVIIGHASASELGNANGKKGDSTGREVCTRSWYSQPWDFMAIHPDKNVREKHAKAVENACANDNIGYGQNDRNTLNSLAVKVNYDLTKVTEKCNCDCSSLQNVCAMSSGANGVTYEANGWTTRTMKTKLKNAGYILIEDKEYLKSSEYCVRGAIYVTAGNHTACGLTNGSAYKRTLSKAGLKDSEANTTSSLNATEKAKSKDSSISGTYVVMSTALNVRNGAGTNYKSLVIIPKGTMVKNYGYYTKSANGTVWLYVKFTYKGITYTGFCSNKYLSRK